MKSITLAALMLVLSVAPAMSADPLYDYCLTAKRWDAGPGAGTYRCGYVPKDEPTCRITWTSNSATGTACWEVGNNWLTLGCPVYNWVSANLLGDIQTCKVLHPDSCTVDPFTGAIHCTRQFWFGYDATGDNGDGL
jgi:hypothetical protein